MECHYFIRRNDLSDGSYADSRTCGSDRKRCISRYFCKNDSNTHCIIIRNTESVFRWYKCGYAIDDSNRGKSCISNGDQSGSIDFLCVCVPAIGMGMSPFSTGGGVFLSFVREDRFQKMMIQSLIAVLCNLGMMVALCAIGILR